MNSRQTPEKRLDPVEGFCRFEDCSVPNGERCEQVAFGGPGTDRPGSKALPRRPASADVAVQDVEVAAKGDLHRRYGIEAVQTIVVADAESVVRASFVGPPSATGLWAAVAEVRQPGSSPEPHLGRPGGAALGDAR